MIRLLAPLTQPFYIDPPRDLVAWAGWLVLFGIVVWGAWLAQEKPFRLARRDIILFGLLLLSAFLLNPFLGVRISIPGALPLPERPEIPVSPALMFFGALPWMLAGGMVGILPATFLGIISGLILGILDTHSPFTVIEYGILALLFSFAVRQRYRTLFFRLLRQPIITVGTLCVLYILIFIIDTSLTAPGLLVGRVDYALTRLPASFLAVAGQMVIAGLVCEVIYQAWPTRWGRQEPLQPSPVEASLQGRFIYSIASWTLLLVVLLMVGGWFLAERSARQMLRDRLSSTAVVAAEAVPYFMETGENLILQYASDPQLASSPAGMLVGILEQDLRSVPYFQQLCVYSPDLEIVASYPDTEAELLNATNIDIEGLTLAFKGVQVQDYTAPPVPGGKSGLVSFIAVIQSTTPGGIERVLWGRTDLASNPFTQPIVRALDDMANLNGEGMLVDGDGNILYYPTPSRVIKPYLGRIYSQPDFHDETASDGTRQLVYYQPTAGQPWAIILRVPAHQVQQLALNSAIPLLIMILLIAGISSLSLMLGLRAVTASLVSLSGEAGRIAQGHLDHPLPDTDAVDESGQLQRAFEQMRISLKARLDELNRLLQVSQGVASTLEIRDAVKPILDAALYEQACLARIVLVEEDNLEPHKDQPERMGVGLASEVYAYLDDQILNLAQQHGAIFLANLTRGRGLGLQVGKSYPFALAAVPLKHENRFYGVLWTAYDDPHVFSEEEIRFLNTLAGEAGLAAANSRLYASAEIGRQRLEAVLVSTPDPVLVTDQQHRVMLANPAAIQLPGMVESSMIGQTIGTAASQRDLIKLLETSGDDQPPSEITFQNGKTYYATVSSVVVDEQLFGKVCIMRDITHYKELDALKSEFVATVSHDLRSPLTLMRGYATMLQMVGELNDQQKGYIRKIILGVESMARLVNNLLDLGRIEAGVSLKLDNIPTGEVAERVISSLQLQAAQKSIQLLMSPVADPPPVVEADLALLQQALYNLVENAIKYTPVGGQVQVAVQAHPLSVQFSVRDNGIGIAPLDQPRLFEKFFRGGQREAYQQRGSGLGLAIVKSIAERHGGRVWLESQLGKGSVFHLEIPIKQR